MPISHYDKLRRPEGIEYIGLNKNKANIAEPRRGALIEVPPLRKNFGDTIKLDERAEPVVQEHAHPTLASSSHAASRAPSMSRSTPPAATLVSPAQV